MWMLMKTKNTQQTLDDMHTTSKGSMRYPLDFRHIQKDPSTTNGACAMVLSALEVLWGRRNWKKKKGILLINCKIVLGCGRERYQIKSIQFSPLILLCAQSSDLTWFQRVIWHVTYVSRPAFASEWSCVVNKKRKKTTNTFFFTKRRRCWRTRNRNCLCTGGTRESG